MAEKKEYKNPTPTMDCIIELSGERIVLIRRANPPTILADYLAYKRTGQRRKI
jgi:ADP-ribose pyrophosphatase YjhB (NUDIX family)